MPTTSKYVILNTAFIDRSKENDPSAYQHVVFREAGKHWKKGDVAVVMRSLETSPLLKAGCFGTAFTYPDLDEGRTKVIYYNKKDVGDLKPSLFVRNLILELPLPKTSIFPDAEPRILDHEAEIADFHQMVLVEDGIMEYSKRSYPESSFGIFKK